MCDYVSLFQNRKNFFFYPHFETSVLQIILFGEFSPLLSAFCEISLFYQVRQSPLESPSVSKPFYPVFLHKLPLFCSQRKSENPNFLITSPFTEKLVVLTSAAPHYHVQQLLLWGCCNPVISECSVNLSFYLFTDWKTKNGTKTTTKTNNNKSLF